MLTVKTIMMIDLVGDDTHQMQVVLPSVLPVLDMIKNHWLSEKKQQHLSMAKIIVDTPQKERLGHFVSEKGRKLDSYELEQELDRLNAELEDLQFERDTLVGEIDDLEGQVDRIDWQISNVEKQLDAAQESLDELDDEDG